MVSSSFFYTCTRICLTLQEKAVLLAETRLEGEAENLRQVVIYATLSYLNSIVSYTVGLNLCTFIIKELRVAHLKCKELESQCSDVENSRIQFGDMKQVGVVVAACC